ncbi:MAG: aminoglycoside phosphotransferase family protein [Acidimicrobiia bacterium]|nr:aminoglycoside phosphotransferase family protein [Acidimicrobiia bacterium]
MTAYSVATTAALEPFLDEATATAMFRRAGVDIDCARPEYLRHKPGETTLISYLFVTGDGDAARGYVHWSVRPERADEILAKARTLRPGPTLVGVTASRIDARSVFYGFPNDARLRRLRWYTTPRKLKRSLTALAPPGEQLSGSGSTVEVLRYKPERRLVAKVVLATTAGTERRLLVRYSTSPRAAGMAAIARRLRGHGVRTPAPLAQLEGGHVGVDELIAGTELRSATRAGGAEPAELAAAVVEFHATTVPSGVGTRTCGEELGRVESGLVGLSRREPCLAGFATTVAGVLRATVPIDRGRSVLLHGDLHDHNVLVTPDGVSFIDLERVAIGPAAIDLGCLRGHAISLDVRERGSSPDARDHADSMIAAYRSRTAPIADHDVAWHTAVAIVDQAILAGRHLAPGWPDTTRALLDAALGELGGLDRARRHVSA